MTEPVLDNVYIGTDLEAMSFAKNYGKWIIELFNAYIGEKVAEVGAGTGNLTQLLSEKKIISELTAFEPSSKMYNHLIQNLNNNKKASLINSTFSGAPEIQTNMYDSIFYINVLEHIEDDEAEVKLMHNALNVDGYACVFVPALSWLYSDFDKSIGHFRRYHKDQLIQLFDSNGFEVVTVKHIDMLGILPWYINFVLMKRMLDQNTTKIYDRYVVPIIRIIDKITPSPIGKNLLLVAKKK
jgi:ubiquinone/menaquinone biosynthesis C-methylase UbiE